MKRAKTYNKTSSLAEGGLLLIKSCIYKHYHQKLLTPHCFIYLETKYCYSQVFWLISLLSSIHTKRACRRCMWTLALRFITQLLSNELTSTQA